MKGFCSKLEEQSFHYVAVLFVCVIGVIVVMSFGVEFSTICFLSCGRKSKMITIKRHTNQIESNCITACNQIRTKSHYIFNNKKSKKNL